MLRIRGWCSCANVGVVGAFVLPPAVGREAGVVVVVDGERVRSVFASGVDQGRTDARSVVSADTKGTNGVSDIAVDLSDEISYPRSTKP